MIYSAAKSASLHLKCFDSFLSLSLVYLAQND